MLTEESESEPILGARENPERGDPAICQERLGMMRGNGRQAVN
jgi:hypothetical protein